MAEQIRRGRDGFPEAQEPPEGFIINGIDDLVGWVKDDLGWIADPRTPNQRISEAEKVAARLVPLLRGAAARVERWPMINGERDALGIKRHTPGAKAQLVREFDDLRLAANEQHEWMVEYQVRHRDVRGLWSLGSPSGVDGWLDTFEDASDSAHEQLGGCVPEWLERARLDLRRIRGHPLHLIAKDLRGRVEAMADSMHDRGAVGDDTAAALIALADELESTIECHAEAAGGKLDRFEQSDIAELAGFQGDLVAEAMRRAGVSGRAPHHGWYNRAELEQLINEARERPDKFTRGHRKVAEVCAQLLQE